MKAVLIIGILSLLLPAVYLPNQTIAYCRTREKELREMLTTAFEVVADLERKGEDVSHLIEDLNQAIGLIETGGVISLAEAKSAIEGVLSSALIRARGGIASHRFQQVKAMIVVCFLAVSTVLVWWFEPRFFWSMWLRSKRDWWVRS